MKRIVTAALIAVTIMSSLATAVVLSLGSDESVQRYTEAQPAVDPEVPVARPEGNEPIDPTEDAPQAFPDSDNFGPIELKPSMDDASVAKRAKSAASDVMCPGGEPCGP
jgi:hypothetical protein